MEIGGECIKTVYISKGVIKGILKKRFDLKKLIAFFLFTTCNNEY